MRMQKYCIIMKKCSAVCADSRWVTQETEKETGNAATTSNFNASRGVAIVGGDSSTLLNLPVNSYIQCSSSWNSFQCAYYLLVLASVLCHNDSNKKDVEVDNGGERVGVCFNRCILDCVAALC